MQRYEIYFNWQKILPPVQQSPNLLKHNIKMWQIVQKPLPHLTHIHFIGKTTNKQVYSSSI